MRWLAALASALLALLTALFTALWLARRELPYNEMGRHFDAASAVVHDAGAVLVYGLLALICGAGALASTLVTLGLWRCRPSGPHP